MSIKEVDDETLSFPFIVEKVMKKIRIYVIIIIYYQCIGI